MKMTYKEIADAAMSLTRRERQRIVAHLDKSLATANPPARSRVAKKNNALKSKR